MQNTDNNKEYCTRCILLVVLKNKLTMHGHMNVNFIPQLEQFHKQFSY